MQQGYPSERNRGKAGRAVCVREWTGASPSGRKAVTLALACRKAMWKWARGEVVPTREAALPFGTTNCHLSNCSRNPRGTPYRGRPLEGSSLGETSLGETSLEGSSLGGSSLGYGMVGI